MSDPIPSTTISATFEAWTNCPSCGCLDLHWLDAPRLAPKSEWDRYEVAMLAWYDMDWDDPIRVLPNGDKVYLWGGKPPKPTPPSDERMFEVFRVCRQCKYRWGIARPEGQQPLELQR